MPLAPCSVNVDVDVSNEKKQVVEVMEDQPAAPEAPCMALVPFSKARKPKVQMMIATLKTKYLQGMEDKSPEECKAALEKKKAELLAVVEAQQEVWNEKNAKVESALEAYKAAKEDVEQAIQIEVEKARTHRAIRDERKDQDKTTQAQMDRLVKAQTKLAMLEVVKKNQDHMKQLKEQRDAALKAAKEAKEQYLAEKKAFAQALNNGKSGGGAGAKGRRGQKRGGGKDEEGDDNDNSNSNSNSSSKETSLKNKETADAEGETVEDQPAPKKARHSDADEEKITTEASPDKISDKKADEEVVARGL